MAHPNDAQGFRERLERVMRSSNLNQAAFARQVGIDRSTLSQLLSPANDRLPRAETLVAIARGCNVSVDWLLGLSQRLQVGAEMVEAPFAFEPQARTPLNDRFFGWVGEADRHKIRTVPLTFPDFLKTSAVSAHEYADAYPPDSGGLAAFEERQRRFLEAIADGLEVEVCFSQQAVRSLARGEAQWERLSVEDRRAQIAVLRSLVAAHYPSLRLFLYDLLDTYSAPFTVFGQNRAAIFIGPGYLVLNASEHIRLLTRRFDELIRAATIQPDEVTAFLDTLA